MDTFKGTDKQNESESDRKRQSSDLQVGDRIYEKKIKLNEKDQRLQSASIEGNDSPSTTTFYDLPLEMVDIILQKSYLHWVLNSSTEQRDEDVMRSLISVDVCFNRRIARKRFKKAIWRNLKEFYVKTKKRGSIIRNNRNYLENSIQPNDDLIAALLYTNCITKEQNHFIRCQRSNRDKNSELLYAMELFDEAKFSTYVNCLRHNDQRTVAKIIENGGDVLKIQIHTLNAKFTVSIERQLLLHQKINDLRDRAKPRSHETDKLIAQLREEGIEILNSQLDGQTVVVWILCHSQKAIENLQTLYASNQLKDVVCKLLHTPISMVINIDNNQFQKTVVVRRITINVTEKIEMSRNELTRGVTKLRHEIYVLCYPFLLIRNIPRIRVFEDRHPFRPQTDFETEEIIDPYDIASSEKEMCLYVSDRHKNCVWKITRETDDQPKIIKWLTTDYEPRRLSMSREGDLVMIDESSHILMIYGSDAELIRSIPRTRDNMYPSHSVETSIGNFIVIEKDTDEDENEDEDEDEQEVEDEDEDENEDEDEEVALEEETHRGWIESRQEEGGSNRRRRGMTWAVSEWTRDGQMVIRRFTPSDETQGLVDFHYLSIDSDDRVFMANPGNDTVILLDSDLKFNRILCPTQADMVEMIISSPERLFYDEEMKQLIVAGNVLIRSQVNVYSLNLN